MILEAVALEILHHVGLPVGLVFFLLFAERIAVESQAAVLLPVFSEGVAECVARRGEETGIRCCGGR